MTSIILGQNLSKINLDKSEFQKLRNQRATIRTETRKMVKVLKRILDEQLENKTCRLCLKPGDKEIFNGAKDFDVALTIRRILGIEILEDDGRPQHICKPCETTLRRASKLKQVAETTQRRLEQEREMANGESSSAQEAVRGASQDPDPKKAYEHSPTTEITPLFTVVESLDWNEAANEEVSTENLLFWRCFKCRKKFQSLEEFRKHEQERPCDEERAPFVCESCGMVLKTLYGLKRHSLLHTSEFPHACQSCPYRARTRYALNAHERQHTGLRPARCAQCDAAFSTASALASHRRRHRPPRHRCQYCQRGFTFRAALENHLATQHSTAKPHHCDLCGKAFATRKLFLRHELQVHKRPKMRSGVPPSYLRQVADTDKDADT